MIQVTLTPAAGKRLIAKGLLRHPAVRHAINHRTIVIVAGTTNGYIAEELLQELGQQENFDKRKFFRGVTVPPSMPTTVGRLLSDEEFLGDVVLRNGRWKKGKTIFDVVDELQYGDVILKGANALDLVNRRAGIFIAHPKGGTASAILSAVIGRRVTLIIPVGLEKRIAGSLDEYAKRVNTAQSIGPRILPVPGEIFTELDAIKILTGARAELIGGGGICGAEGVVWLAIDGEAEQEEAARTIIDEVKNEPPFTL